MPPVTSDIVPPAQQIVLGAPQAASGVCQKRPVSKAVLADLVRQLGQGLGLHNSGLRPSDLVTLSDASSRDRLRAPAAGAAALSTRRTGDSKGGAAGSSTEGGGAAPSTTARGP